jgi:hypothetical protein
VHKEKLNSIEILAHWQKRHAQSFNVIDVLQAIKYIGDYKIISRTKLAKLLNIGEGSIRTMIKRMKNLELISIIKSGILLKEKGNSIYNILIKYIKKEFELPEIVFNKLTGQRHNYCLITSNLSEKIKKGIEERDTAIKFGANILVTLVYKAGKFYFPDGFEFNGNYTECTRFLLNKTTYDEGDVIIISGSDNEKGAKNGAYAAFYNLLKKLIYFDFK